MNDQAQLQYSPSFLVEICLVILISDFDMIKSMLEILSVG